MAPLHPIARAVALLTLSLSAAAQQASLPTVTVRPGAAPAADITGFGDFPRRDVPVSTRVIERADMEAVGARRLADLTRFDASVSDAYNAPGYWDFVSIRGFILDNRFNYRREGLPINAQTTIPLDNKERVELLKGTSGIQAGNSAPGGLVNYVVKRPTEQPLRQFRLEAGERGSLLAAVDLSNRFGEQRDFGIRINAAQERLRPLVRATDGDRSLLAVAGDWRAGAGGVLEAEVEWSTREQASQVGFSLLGPSLPQPGDPRVNLNNQPWVQPSRFEGLTGTLRWTQALDTDWRWSAQLGSQRLRSDDYSSFAFGCFAEGFADRYCRDGSFDMYDFRSENERRRVDSADLNLRGRVRTGPAVHQLTAGVLFSRATSVIPPAAYNYAGTGTVDAATVLPAAPAPLGFDAPDRSERTRELYLHDAIQWTDRFTTWLGVRHTRLARDYRQNLTTPWVAASYKFPELLAYGSWGRGVESQQVSNSPLLPLSNAGAVLPASRSRQWEFGLRGGSGPLRWNTALFDIRRPLTNEGYCIGVVFSATPCTVGEVDGEAAHRGLEADAQWSQGPWRLGAGATLLRAERRGSAYEPAANGQRPTNVPDHILRATAAYQVQSLPGLSVEGHVSREGPRAVLSDASLRLPAWTRLDAAASYRHTASNVKSTWTLSIHNLTGERAWRESPRLDGHVYLYPLAPRTVRLSFVAEL